MSDTEYTGCTCSELTLRFYFCECGARSRAFEQAARELIPTLTESQIKVMTTLIPVACDKEYNLRRLGLSTGVSRSGDNASILTDFGVVVQNILLDRK